MKTIGNETQKKKSEPEKEKPRKGKKAKTTREFECDLRIDSSILRQALRVIGVLRDEVDLKFRKDGVHVKIVDPAHVCMGGFYLPVDVFEEYTFSARETKGKKTKDLDEQGFGIDVEYLEKFLKKVGYSGPVDIHLKDDKMFIHAGNIKRSFTSVDMSGEEPTVPKLQLDTHIELKKSEVVAILGVIGDLTDNVEIVVDPSKVVFRGRGDINNVELELEKDMLERLEVGEPGRSLYPLDYLQSMFAAIPSESVSLHLKADFPMTIDFGIVQKFGRDSEEGQLTVADAYYLIAPRIESEC